MTYRQAATNLIAPVQRALSCITNARIDTPSGYDPNDRHALVLSGGQPVTVQTDKHVSLGMSVLQNYRIVVANDEGGTLKVKSNLYAPTPHADHDDEILADHLYPRIVAAYPPVHKKGASRTDV